ncbi:MAG: YitT family protein [Odoribacteraceae bacterium]|jgi:uncharacterized membrane-anchored protein YitT (DUF2179 family)|nr:YitT family protein [Odoribacteraceae bacterium]
MKRAAIFSEARSYVLITFGLVIYAFGVTAFLVPHKIVGGGVTGISTIIYFLTHETIPVGISYLVINALLVGIAIKILGPKFGIKTIYAVFINSALLSLFQAHIHEPLLDDRFMSTIIAGILCGAGVGVSLANGGSTAGTDIVAMIINKYRNISPGKVIMYLDVIIIGSSFLISWKFQDLIYGYVQMGVLSYTIDMVFTGRMQSVQFFIFSEKYDRVADAITRDLHRGVTVLDCQGWYTGAARKMLLVVARKSEMQGIMRVTKLVDPDAFLTMNTVMGVYGKGFDTLRT